jgi:cell division protein FtsA
MGRQNGHTTRRQRLISVLDVGTSKVCCMIARAEPAPKLIAETGDRLQLRVVGFGHQRSEGIKSGTVVDMDAAERAIRAAVDQAERCAGMTIDDVILSVSCGRLRSDNFSATVAIAGDEVRDADIDRVASGGRDYAGRDGRTVLHCISTGYRLDGDTVISDPRGMIADQLSLDIHAVTADEQPLKNLILCVERCHLSVTGLVAAPFASGLAAVVDDEAKLGVTCIDLGAGTTSVAVFSDGNFVFSDAFAVGGNHVTIDLARALSTPLEAAERIKTLHGSAFAATSDEREMVEFPIVGENEAPQTSKVTKAQIAQLIQPRIEEILQLARDRLEASGFSELAGSQVVLTGGWSQLTGLPEYAARVLSKAVRLGRSRQFPGLPERGVGPAFSAAVGLLVFSQRERGEIMPRTRAQYLGTGTGYLSRVSQWIRESF